METSPSYQESPGPTVLPNASPASLSALREEKRRREGSATRRTS